MNKSTIRYIAGGTGAALALLTLGTFALWRYEKYTHLPPAPTAVVLRDRSDSGLSDCGQFAAMAEELLSKSSLRAGSSISIMATGDAATADEPILLDSFAVPATQKVLEGRSKITNLRQELLSKTKTLCEQTGQTKRSPIYLAIRRAVEHLRNKGCGKEEACILYVQSDLEEFSEPGIKAALTAKPAARAKNAGDLKLPSPIGNENIIVKICGISETKGEVIDSGGKPHNLTPKRDADKADQVRSIWEKLFTQPELVSFGTHCPRV